MADEASIPLPTVITTQPTSNDTPDSPDNLSEPLNESPVDTEVEKRRRQQDGCCYYNENDCICDEGDILDWFCLCRCIGHIFQSFGHCIGSCCDNLGDCFQGCGECMCNGCCETGGDTVTDAADGGDCDCGDCDCDCGDCDCF